MSRGPGGRVGEKREREELGCYCRCWHARTRNRSIYLGVVITSKKSQAVLCMEFQNFDNRDTDVQYWEARYTGRLA